MSVGRYLRGGVGTWQYLYSTLLVLVLSACGFGHGSKSPKSTCDNVDIDIDRVWSSTRKSEVRAGILRVGGEVGETVVERVITRMDDLSRDWALMQRNLCEEHSQGRLSSVMYQKKTDCLMVELVSQRTLVTVLHSPTKDTLFSAERAIATTAERVQECLEDAIASEYGQRGDASRNAQSAIARSEAFLEIGRKNQAEDAAKVARRKAKESRDARIKVRALIVSSRGAVGKGELSRAKSFAWKAFKLAKSVKYVLGQARSLAVLTEVSYFEEQYDDAAKYGVESVELYRAALDKEHPEIASISIILGDTYLEVGQGSTALSWYEEAMKIRMRKLGTRHPDTGEALHRIGMVYGNNGNNSYGQIYFRKALNVFLHSVGREHPRTALALHHMCVSHRNTQNFEEALWWCNESATVYLKLGEELPSALLVSLGLVNVDLGNKKTGLDWYRLAVKVRLEVYGAGHPLTRQAVEKIIRLCREGYAAACPQPKRKVEKKTGRRKKKRR